MIGTITLNPCIDKTLTIHGFTYGSMNRVSNHRSDVSGKGINVSIVLTQLGIPVRTLGISYKNGAQIMKEALSNIGIRYEAVKVNGRLRENMKVLDEESGVTTEFNQKGDFISEEKLIIFEEMLDNCLDDLSILVVTGSVPEGVRPDYYYRLIEKAKKKGIKTVLDAEGEFLLEGLAAKPYIIKPNLFEFKMAFGLKTNEVKDILAISRQIIAEGVNVVCLSMGSKGAMIVNRKEAYLCSPTKTMVKSTQGAGDSLVAGMCIAMERGLPISEMLRYGVAAAQGSLLRKGTLLCTREGFEEFERVVTVQRVDE